MKYSFAPRLSLAFGLAALALLLAFGASSSPAQFITSPGDASASSVPQAQLIQPEALAHLLQSGGAPKPLLLQVGSHVLYAEGHIPGSVYIGAGSQPTGLQALQSRVASVSRKQFIVLYCGCCPWNHCPNVGPAFHQLQAMGFTNVKVLYLANNFGADWVDKGYPVEPSR
jgi:3-mercaptopyruvate sulfurtransferase SseA